MKVVILAGGLGTRLSEETHLRPKPMVEIGGKPIIWHIMKHYAHHGFTDFIICAGYKSEVIKQYFHQYLLYTSDVTFDLAENKLRVLNSKTENWKVTIVDTGLQTMTGGRLKKVAHLLDDNEPFFFTYGDGLSDIDFSAELNFHYSHGRTATIAAVTPPGRYGALALRGSQVTSFIEKPLGDGTGRINGGFFILNKSTIEYIDGDHTSFELEPLERLSKTENLMAYKHDGFWQPMDTLRDKNSLEELWQSGEAPWSKTPDIHINSVTHRLSNRNNHLQLINNK